MRDLAVIRPRRKENEAALAQLVEHRIRNAGVACSSHAGGTILTSFSIYEIPKAN